MKLKALILYAASVMAVLAVAAGILSGCRKENAAEAREHMTAARIIVSPDLSPASKLVLILTMFIGRLGAFTLFSLWVERPEPSARYTEEMITIG